MDGLSETELIRRRDIAIEAAYAAGRAITDLRAKKGFSVSMKGDVNLVTTADLTAEELIVERIRAELPGERILAEESASAMSTDELRVPLWIIDPVDGTTNYAHGHHQVGISIAFALDGITQTGVVYSPFQNELFSAMKGSGAELNGTRIEVSKAPSLGAALIGTGFPYARSDIALLIRRLESVLKRCRDIRRVGAASLDLCWVACGRLDGFYESLEPWDMAAGLLIAREAGATFGHIGDSGPLPDLDAVDLVVASPQVFAELIAVLRAPDTT